MIYGHDKTIHRTGNLNVEVDKHGKVVAVWFRCMALPFDQRVVDADRAKTMQEIYEGECQGHRFHSPNESFIRAIDIDVPDTQEPTPDGSIEQADIRIVDGKRFRRIKA